MMSSQLTLRRKKMKRLRYNVRQVMMLIFFTVISLFLTEAVPVNAINVFDVNGDSKEGLEEAVHALQTAAGISPPYTESGEYVLFAWNDLGMHCLNPTYNTAVILPPYNTVCAGR